MITKKQLAGLAMIAGLAIAAATGCQKETVNPVKTIGINHLPIDSTGGYGKGPKIRTADTDTIGNGDSGDEDGPKFPIKKP